MSSRFETIEYGPFNAAYHRAIVDNDFKQRFQKFLTSTLLPQVDHDFDVVKGKLTASFDEDRYCGPHSLVRHCFKFKIKFLGPADVSELSTELIWNGDNEFSSRRGSSFYLWTPSRQDKRRLEQVAIQETMNNILDLGFEREYCPCCSAELLIYNTPFLFDVVCPNRCFKYNFHRNEQGEPTHGHFFMSDPQEDA